MTSAAPAGRARSRWARPMGIAVFALIVAAGLLLLTSAGAYASGPAGPAGPPSPGGTGLTITVNGPNGKPADAIVTILGIALLSVSPALLIMMSSFTKIFIVLSMTRNAIGLNTVPPNQVITGLALFLGLFIMAPVLTDIDGHALQPFLTGRIDIAQALTAAEAPLRTFMGAHTREEDIALLIRAAGRANPANIASVPFGTLVPAFVLSEVRTAFIIGFVIFIPFLVIDLVVSSGLMSMGMMMLPPMMISLPFKVLLFILVNGWGLVIEALVGSYK